MTIRQNLTHSISGLMLLLTILGATLAQATSEGNYKAVNNLLTNTYEATLTESGYNIDIIINPDAAGIYATENGYKLDFAIITQGIGGQLTENSYQLDLTPQKGFPSVADNAVTKIAVSKTVVGLGYSVRINQTVSNQALYYETLHLVINANTTILKTQKITLTGFKATTISFLWNTTGIAYGNYAICAYAEPAPGETYTADNTCIYGTIAVTIPGDVDGNFAVTILDVVKITGIYASKLGDLNFNPNSDINNDHQITILDVVICTGHYGQKYP